MAIQITLEDIKAATEKKFGDVEITNVPVEGGDPISVILRNPVNLKHDERKAISTLQDSIDEDDEDVDQGEFVDEMLRIVCANKRQADALLNFFGDDLAGKATLISEYQDAISMGEASPSQD